MLIKFLISIILLLLVTATGLVALIQTQPDEFKPLVEHLGSRILDRKLEIGELSTIRLGADSHIKASNISLANPAWSEEKDLLAVAQLELFIHLPSLWRDGPVLIREVNASGVRVDLQARDDGRANWQLDARAGDTPDEAMDDSQSPPLPLLIERADIGDVRLHFHDAERDVQTELSAIQIASRDSDSFTTLAITGQVNGRTLQANGFMGPTRALHSGRDLVLNLELALDKLLLKANGKVADAANLVGAELNLAIEAPRSRFLLDLLGLEEVRDGPLSLNAQVSDGRPGILLDARARVAGLALELDGRVNKPALADGIDLTFGLKGPSLTEVGAMLGVQGFKAVPFSLSGRVRRESDLLAIDGGLLQTGDGHLTINGELPEFPDIDNWSVRIEGQRLDLSILAAMLGSDPLPAIPSDIDGQLAASPEGVELIELNVSTPWATLTLDGAVGELPELHNTDLRARLKGDDLSLLEPFIALENMPAEAFEFSARISESAGGWHVRDTQITSGQFLLQVSAEVDRLLEPQKIEGSARFSTANLPAALEAYGIAPPEMKPVPMVLEGKARLVPGGFDIQELRGTLADLVFSGSGRVSKEENWANSRIILKSQGDDLGKVLASVAELKAPASPYQLSMDATWHAPLISIDQLDLEVGEHQLRAELQLAEDTNGEAISNGKARLEGSSLRELLNMLGLELAVNEENYQLQTSIVAVPGQLALNDLQFQGKHSDLAGNLKLQSGATPRLDVNLHSKRLHLPFLLPKTDELAAQPELEPEPKSRRSNPLLTPTTAAQLERRIIPDTPLPLDWINRIDGNWQYQIDRITVNPEAEARFNIALDINAGVLRSREIKWHGTVSNGSAELALDARDANNSFQLSLDSNRIPLLWMVSDAKKPSHNALYRGRLNGSGGTVREVVASLNGALVFSGSGFKLNNRGLDLMMGDVLSSIAERLNPTQDSEEFTPVVCHAAAVTVTDGLLELDPGLTIRTDRVDIGTFGALDLRDESLAITFKARPRKGLGISAAKAISPYMMLAGNLAHPYLTVDPEGVVVSGGAAIATAGLSLIAENLWSRWKTATENTCEIILQRAAKNDSGVFQGLLPSPVEVNQD